jgi:hypothetical protein
VYMCCIHDNNHLSFGLPVSRTLNMPWGGLGVALGVVAGCTWQWLALCECARFELRSNLGLVRWLTGSMAAAAVASKSHLAGAPHHTLFGIMSASAHGAAACRLA